MQEVGPIHITGPELNAKLKVPLATYESPLWLSVRRGAKISRLCEGISVAITADIMARSILLEAKSAIEALAAVQYIEQQQEALAQIAATTSRFAKLKQLHTQVVGNLVYIRFGLSSGDAAGHNMVTQAAEKMLHWILQQCSTLSYVSLSGNYCSDKKAGSVNGILGRGKYVVAEIVIPKSICEHELRAKPQQIVDLNIKKNLIGTQIAGGVRSANAHFANILLAIYLATGQDAANIVEGSQGTVYAALKQEDLYFSVTLPNVIVGTVGNGKDLPFVQHNLEQLGCLVAREPGMNARRLAAIIGAAVLCGELSLLAALVNPDELMRSHLKFERNHDIPKTKEVV